MRIRCDKCLGKRKLFGLGMIKEDCSKCNGKGYTDVEEVKEIKSAKNSGKKKIVDSDKAANS